MFKGISLIGLLSWCVLLSTICRSPASPDVNHHITYSCHGTIVYITWVQQALLIGLIPALLLFGFIVTRVENKREAGDRPNN